MAIYRSEAPELNFEEAMARLEQIVRALEGGNVPLDESLTLYEEGVKLIKFCTKALDDAEQKVKILQKGEDGMLVEVDFIKTEGAEQ